MPAPVISLPDVSVLRALYTTLPESVFMDKASRFLDLFIPSNWAISLGMLKRSCPASCRLVSNATDNIRQRGRLPLGIGPYLPGSTNSIPLRVAPQASGSGKIP
jgi:hypothetical protein